MIIETAIDRIKQQQERQAQRSGAVRYEVRRTAPPERRPTALTFPQMKYDAQLCEGNRILVPEAHESEMAYGFTAYRMLRTRVLQQMRANRWQTLAITSPGPGEGKSVTSLNLALSLAREQNQNVFLLDLDMCNPSVCPYLGITPHTGILRAFTGEAQPEDVFFSIGIDGLAIAGGIEATPFSSELLATGRMEHVLKYISSTFPDSVILLDLPPVLATDDFLVAAPRVDATLLVLAEGKTRRDAVTRTMEVLTGFPLAGVMLNQSQERVTDYYNRQYYYYGKRRGKR
jgi:Mrp family chromosome partitioning ATPase